MENLIISTIKKILKVLPKGYKKKSAIMMTLLFINSVMELFGLAAFLPLFTVILQEGVIETHPIISKVYQLGRFTSEIQFIISLSLMIVVIILIKNLLSLFIVKKQATFALSLHKLFAIRLHEHFYRKGFPFFKKTNSNVIMRDINSIPQRFATNLVLPIFNFINELFILTFILISLMIYDWKAISLLSFSILPLFLIFYRWVKNRSSAVENAANDIQPLLAKSIFQSIHGYTDVEITNTQQRFRTKISSLLDKLVSLSIKRTIYQQAPSKVIETGMVMTIFAMTIYGLFFLPDRGSLAALLGLFALAAYRVLPSVNRIMIALISIKGFQFTFDTIMQVKENNYPAIKNSKLSFNERIVLDNISFHFPDTDKFLLKDINLTVNKGDNIGFIGPSGAGKTTLMNIILGFWEPIDGKILIDNIELNAETMNSWRNKVGYVQQEVFILDGTISDNIAFGESKNEIDLIKLKSALKQASLFDFVESLPEKANTLIGERGAKLSGGQRQRIGIARAIYTGATVLFFDEATSALDIQTEEEITESIKNLKQSELTIIVIAHRLSTLKHCDKIIKVDKQGLYNMEITNFK